MTVEEKLEKLTERHEALAQTVEITLGMQRANEANIAKLIVSSDSLVRSLDTLKLLSGPRKADQEP